MKTVWALAAALALLLCAGPASAQVLVEVDENCNGFITIGGVRTPLTCTVMPDPFAAAAGFNISVPTFMMPGPVLVAGDILVDDAELPRPNITDLIRFLPNPNRLLFYSTPETFEPPDGDLSDIFLPNGFPNQPNNMFVMEQGRDGDPSGTYFLYTPQAGQPGFIPNWLYFILSDTPEPASILLLACEAGMVGFAGWLNRRRQVA
jgi:hypothetical protein